MKKQLSITLLAIVILAAVLLNLSCGGTSPNNTSVSNVANGNAAPGTTAQSSQTFADPDCSGDATGKQKKIKDGIKDNIKKDGKLESQHMAKNFDFEPVVDAKGDATLYIWGNIFTARNDLDNLNKTYKDFVKKGCVTKVIFTSAPTMPASAAGFSFSSCEAPNQICSDGSCQEVCVKQNENTNNNMNSKSNK